MLAWFEEGFQFEVTEVMLEFLFSGSWDWMEKYLVLKIHLILPIL